jgi:hypothetical protein
MDCRFKDVRQGLSECFETKALTWQIRVNWIDEVLMGHYEIILLRPV